MDDQLFIIDTSADPRLAILPSLNTPNSNNHISKLTTEIQQPIVAPLPSSIAHSPPSLLSRPPPSTLISSPTRDPISTSTSTRANEDLLQLKHPDEPDPTESAPAAQRYWKEPTGITCTICHEPDHSARNCDHQLCLTCGAIDEHITRLCPVSLVCFACGSRGHLSRHCPSSSSSRILGKDCLRCGSGNHLSLNCPSIWRRYEEIDIPNRKTKSLTLACYNCGDTGDHFGDECPFGRVSRSSARIEPSAFSMGSYSHNRSQHHSRSRSRHPSDHREREPEHRSRDSTHRSNATDHRPRDRYHDRDHDRPPPSSHSHHPHHPRRSAPAPYEVMEEEEEDWFSRRHRTNPNPGPRRAPSQPKKPRQDDGHRKRDRPTGKSSGGQGKSQREHTKDADLEKRERIGGSYKGGYTKR